MTRMSRKDEEGSAAFSSRSVASLRREADLRDQLAKVVAADAGAAKKQAAVTKDIEGAKSTIRTGRGWQSQQNLDEWLVEKQGVDARRATLAQMTSELDGQIEFECAIAPDRAGVQAAFAEVARRRLEFDGRIEKQLEELRDALRKRAEFTRELRGLAERIEFEGDLDAARFEKLAASLPYILPASERWYGQNAGHDVPGVVRAVARIAVELPETLHHTGRAQAGDALLLTEEQFAELSQSRYTLKAGDGYLAGEQAKYFTPRRVVSFEQAERDRAAAENAGRSITNYWRAEDESEFQLAEKARAREYNRQRWDRTLEHVRSMNGLSLEDARRHTEREYGARP